MRNTSKGKQIYLFNAYSKKDSSEFFLSGSDRVGLELINHCSSEVIVLAPLSFKSLVPDRVLFISTQDKSSNFLIYNYFYRTIHAVRQLKSLISSNDSIVSTSDYFCDTLPAWWLSKKVRWYAFTFHLYPSAFKKFNLRNLLGGFSQLLSFILFRSTKKILTTNIEILSLLQKKFNLENIQKINLGVSLDLYKNNNSNRNIDLLYLGRIKDSKGIFLLPELVSKIIHDIPFLKVEVIGNGNKDDLERLNQLIIKFKVQENIKITSGLKDDEISEKLKNTKYLIQLSSEEGFGLVILEALASGCQVIGFDLPVYRENFFKFKLNLIKNFDEEKLSLLIIEKIRNYSYINPESSSFSDFDWKVIYGSIFNN